MLRACKTNSIAGSVMCGEYTKTTPFCLSDEGYRYRSSKAIWTVTSHLTYHDRDA